MRSDLDGFVDEVPPRRTAVRRIKGLSPSSKIVLGGCVLLFFSLFLTWQNLEVDYGRAGTGTQLLDGWDLFGLLIGMLSLGLLLLIVVVRMSDVDVSADFPWELLTLVVASTILGLVVLKNLTDRDSAWVSYLGLVLAAGVVAGAFLDWSQAIRRGGALVRRRRRRVRPAA
jgi:hypothetical protein